MKHRAPTPGREPAACNDDPTCNEGGTWGATGILPPGHFMHRTENGAYLAHGVPSAADFAFMLMGIDSELWAAIDRARNRRDAKLAALYVVAGVAP